MSVLPVPPVNSGIGIPEHKKTATRFNKLTVLVFDPELRPEGSKIEGRAVPLPLECKPLGLTKQIKLKLYNPE